MDMVLLQIHELVKRYSGRTVLDRVSIDVHERETDGLCRADEAEPLDRLDIIETVPSCAPHGWHQDALALVESQRCGSHAASLGELSYGERSVFLFFHGDHVLGSLHLILRWKVN